MKKSIAIMTAAILCAALCACGKAESSQDSGDYIYGQISSISGNDVTLLLAEYTEQSSDDTSAEGAESAADGEGKPQDGGGRGGFGGGMPEGFDPENMPQGGFDPENMPEGFDPENMPQGGFDRENMPNRGSGTKIGNYTLTGETKEVRIPVGVTITTTLGVETDFDALKTGDMIKCSLKNDSKGDQAITAVWIVE